MQNSDPIADPWRRFWRTVVQVAAAFLSFAAIYPLVLAAIDAPDSSNVGVWLATGGVWITTAAGIISRVMAIPAVNDFLGNVKLDSYQQASTVEEPDVDTKMLTALTSRNSGEFNGVGAF